MLGGGSLCPHVKREASRFILSMRYDERLMSVLAKDVLTRIQSGDAEWETMVPPAVAETIKATRLLGVRS